jgi:hypothetical protein
MLVSSRTDRILSNTDVTGISVSQGKIFPNILNQKGLTTALPPGHCVWKIHGALVSAREGQ